MRNHLSSIVSLTVLALALAFVSAPAGEAAAEEPEEAAAGEKRDINIVALFLGATTKFKDKVPDETSFTMAGEYEILPSDWGHKWGIGGTIEMIFAHELEGLLIPMVYYHPAETWFVRGGVGLEIGREEDATSGSAYLLVRTGVGYDIPLKRVSLIPSLDFDVVRSDIALVYGVVIAKKI